AARRAHQRHRPAAQVLHHQWRDQAVEAHHLDLGDAARGIENERRAHWVKPVLVAEVTFSEWTQDGHVRHPVFHALRSDKPAKQIVREAPV
ncbi:hypothetical protein FGX01_04755, partial [Xylella fastidiosa subsp. multiplex]|nr:hypothetical protein [Xylella fastidiosa subsp. multiplex]